MGHTRASIAPPRGSGQSCEIRREDDGSLPTGRLGGGGCAPAGCTPHHGWRHPRVRAGLWPHGPLVSRPRPRRWAGRCRRAARAAGARARTTPAPGPGSVLPAVRARPFLGAPSGQSLLSRRPPAGLSWRGGVAVSAASPSLPPVPHSVPALGPGRPLDLCEFPRRPPRLLPGASDTLRVAGVAVDGSALGFLYNPYAAMPSLHVGWALLAGSALVGSGRAWRLRAAGVALPLLMALTVLLTGNHYVLDILAGALTAAGAWLAVAWWSRAGQWRRLLPSRGARVAAGEDEDKDVSARSPMAGLLPPRASMSSRPGRPPARCPKDGRRAPRNHRRQWTASGGVRPLWLYRQRWPKQFHAVSAK